MTDEPASEDSVPRIDSETLLRGILVVLLFVVATLFGYWYVASRYADTDMFWHLATGRWILEHGAIPTKDVFSWWGIANNRPWVPQGWLFDVGGWALYALGGYTAVYMGVGVLQGALAVLFYWLGRLRGLSTMWAMLVTFVCLLGTVNYIVARPQMLTYCLLLVVMILLEKKHYFWALPVITLGVNVHGGMWVVYLAVYALYAWPEKWQWIAGALVAAGINPQPIGTFAYPFLAYGTAATKQINEYAPTALWSLGPSFMTYFVVFLLVVARRVRIPWKEAAFCIAFVVLGLTGLRHVVWMYVLVIPLLAPYLTATAEILGHEGVERYTAWQASRTPAASESDTAVAVAEAAPAVIDDEEHADRPSRSLRMEAITAVVLAIAAIGFLWADTTIVYEPETYYPVAMLEYMRKNKIEKAFTGYNEGGFLIFKGYAPLVDGRFDPFVARFTGDKDILTEYFDVEDFRIDMGTFLRKYGIRELMIPRDALAVSLQQNPAFVVLAATQTHVLMRYDEKLDRAAPGFVDPSRPATGSIVPTGTPTATATPGATTAP